MAIAFNCPHCDKPYRLKDELAGREAKCSNPACRRAIVVPQPQEMNAAPRISDLGGIVPAFNGRDHQQPRPIADVEAAALSALNEVAKVEVVPVEQVVAVICSFCDHKWNEPIAKAGKNVLCPNPECRQRVKVPEPKVATAQDWREQPKGPSLRKENFEKPKDVVDADAKIVSREAWQKGGGAEQELEPIALSRRLFFGLLIGVPLIALVSGAVYLWQSRVERGKDRFMEDAVKESIEGMGDLPPAEAPLYSGLLQIAQGEYAMRQDEPNAKAALDHFTRSLNDIRQAAAKDERKTFTAGRNAVACELALASLLLGGTEEQARAGTRIRWLPDDLKRALKVNEKRYDVHTELQRILELIRPAEFDLKAALARRLTRELVKQKQLDLAADIPVMLFSEAEQPEAKAIVALEMYRQDKGSAKVRQLADELKVQLEKGAANRNPVPASAQTLWLILGTEKAPTLVFSPPAAPSQQVPDPSRLAHTGLLLLQNKPEEALALARRPGSLGGQLRALTLCAEWLSDPGAAVDAAVAFTVQPKGKKDAPPPPVYVVFRLAQLAAASGKVDQAKALADSIADDGLKAWAKGDALRLAAAVENKGPLEEGAAEVPEDAKKLRAGHAWGRFWVARHNTALSHDQTKEKKAVANWPRGTIHPFGFAGIALGLKDK